MNITPQRILWSLLLPCALIFSGCDSGPSDSDEIVAEIYIEAGRPLPPAELFRTMPLEGLRDPERVSGASVAVELDGRNVDYSEVSPGRYEPRETVVANPGSRFRLRVAADGALVTASGVVPPVLRIDSVRVSVPPDPIQAVLLDSLALRVDSLGFSIPSRTGYIYPVTVDVWWHSAPGTVTGSWIETTLDPVEQFSSALVDFFLLPSSVLEEPSDARPLTWSGLYAVPVDGRDDPLPAHDLRVSAVRGTLDYARFALSRRDPDRREPVGNLTGGVGIAAGISLDSVRVHVQ